MKITTQLRVDRTAADSIAQAPPKQPPALAEAQGQMEPCKICH